MTQREISLKKDETLLVKWMAEPFRYARLVRAVSDRFPRIYVFDLHPGFEYIRTQYGQIEVQFQRDYYETTLLNGVDRQLFRAVGSSSWGSKTVKQLLVSELSEPIYAGGYEIVDWGGFAVPDDRPANS
ncbi:hypothetical protein [Nocardia sp. CS682]|uniref:hypothetical protein n=1 Tax=Nocardia sp. CS682 TaxID=1047172 RepID=UPI001074CCA5|nr:hypothetical protein [Nocardia sp. CS682]QBS42003.1 hypothetical protein DMB37_19550 [Nocardia sp. CS682]